MMKGRNTTFDGASKLTLLRSGSWCLFVRQAEFGLFGVDQNLKIQMDEVKLP